LAQHNLYPKLIPSLIAATLLALGIQNFAAGHSPIRLHIYA